MNQFISPARRFRASSWLSQTLVFTTVWIAGIMLGFLRSTYADHSFLSLMRMAAAAPVSIVGLFIVVYLPFLITALAVNFSRRILLYVVCFLKAYSFMSCSVGIYCAFQSAGWLVRLLMQFSDICTVPLLCWFALRCLQGNRLYLRKDLILCTIFCVLIGYLDYGFISPFLATLI